MVRYLELLGQLPAINYKTLRKLMGHLSIVAGQMEKNLMPVINLAPLWGPNILTVDSQAGAGAHTDHSPICSIQGTGKRHRKRPKVVPGCLGRREQ
jgi:hypothetical protein